MFYHWMTACLERTNAALMGRPTVMGDRKTVTYGEGMRGMGVDIFIDLQKYCIYDHR